MKKMNITILTMVLLTLTSLYGGKVKSFDLNEQILNSKGAKIEKFQVTDDLIVETNMILCGNQQCYKGPGKNYNENGFFALDFSKAQTDFEIHMVVHPQKEESTWRFVDEFGETQYLYAWEDSIFNIRFSINNKKSIKYKLSYDVKLIVKNKKVTVYVNNEKIGFLNLSKLQGIKRIEFNRLRSLSDFFIVKDK